MSENKKEPICTLCKQPIELGPGGRGNYLITKEISEHVGGCPKSETKKQ